MASGWRRSFGWRALTSAAWLRAPLFVASVPVIALVLAGTLLIAGLVVASARVFAAGAATACVRRDLGQGCRFDAGLRAQTVAAVPRVAASPATEIGGP